MELKKKTIIWEDNNEPPKDYIWIKSDEKAYEFDYNDRTWKESTSINVNNNGSDDGSGGGDASISELINDAKNLVIKITQSGYNKVYPNEGAQYKSSFELYENENNFDQMISVPIENYLDISNMDVYKIIMNFINSDLNAPEIYLKRIDYHVGQNSTASEVKILKPEFSQHCVIEYNEIGRGSGGGGSYCYFNLDPNDITKVMVYPEDA